MKAKITIDMSNAAFEDAPSGTETARILRELADRLDQVELSPIAGRGLCDINGNTVGEFTVTK